MTTERLTLGEYVRRLRRAKEWSLSKAAEQAGVSYSYMSRLENGSALPTAETLAKIASGLDGDLKMMLERAHWLPAEILERITTRQQADSSSLKRSAHRGVRAAQKDAEDSSLVRALANSFHMDEQEARTIVPAVRALASLDTDQRDAVMGVIQVIGAGEDAATD